MNKTLFAIGLVIIGIDAVLLLTNVSESGIAAAAISNIKRMR